MNHIHFGGGVVARIDPPTSNGSYKKEYPVIWLEFVNGDQVPVLRKFVVESLRDDKFNRIEDSQEISQAVNKDYEKIQGRIQDYRNMIELEREESERLAQAKQSQNDLPTESVGWYRIPHCFKCKKRLDSRKDLICPKCGWILCSCGACGCDYDRDWRNYDY